MAENLSDLLNLFCNLDEDLKENFNELKKSIQEEHYFPASELRDSYGDMISKNTLDEVIGMLSILEKKIIQGIKIKSIDKAILPAFIYENASFYIENNNTYSSFKYDKNSYGNSISPKIRNLTEVEFNLGLEKSKNKVESTFLVKNNNNSKLFSNEFSIMSVILEIYNHCVIWDDPYKEKFETYALKYVKNV